MEHGVYNSIYYTVNVQFRRHRCDVIDKNNAPIVRKSCAQLQRARRYVAAAPNVFIPLRVIFIRDVTPMTSELCV